MYIVSTTRVYGCSCTLVGRCTAKHQTTAPMILLMIYVISERRNASRISKSGIRAFARPALVVIKYTYCMNLTRMQRSNAPTFWRQWVPTYPEKKLSECGASVQIPIVQVKRNYLHHSVKYTKVAESPQTDCIRQNCKSFSLRNNIFNFLNSNSRPIWICQKCIACLWLGRLWPVVGTLVLALLILLLH